MEGKERTSPSFGDPWEEEIVKEKGSKPLFVGRNLRVYPSVTPQWNLREAQGWAFPKEGRVVTTQIHYNQGSQFRPPMQLLDEPNKLLDSTENHKYDAFYLVRRLVI